MSLESNQPRASGPESVPLYAEHKKVYPKSVKGPHRRIKWLVLILIMTGYYVLPWLRWDRGIGLSDQAVLFDLYGRKLFFFDIEIWPQQIYYVTFILVFSAIGLFFVTALFGRLWCGYACPQTLWTDLFMLVERWIEGDRGDRIRRDEGPNTTEKVTLKLAKHAVWLTIALSTGGWWIFYFYDAPTLVHDVFAGTVPGYTVTMIGILTLITYFLAGYLREHTCTFMCPWPRFQAAMQDEESLVVSYRAWRGEKRAHLRRSVGWDQRQAQGLGDCIDCRACVAVCPTGIDIRNGSQLQCIGCALCIDACDEVMTKIGRPRGLVAFDTENNLVACAAAQAARPRLVRPRTIVYALLLTIIGTALVVIYEQRQLAHVSILRDRAPLFVRLADGQILNGYTVKISNMTRDAQTFKIGVEGIAGATLVRAGSDDAPVPELHLPAGADGVATYRVMVRVPHDALHAVATPLHFVVRSESEPIGDDYDGVFMGPTP